MNRYEWILFDADDTLFRFDAKAGLKRMFQDYGVTFSDEDYHNYQKINLPLWEEYQNGLITAETLKRRRFETWSSRTGTTPEELNQSFLSAMAEICQALPGVSDMLTQVQKHAKLGIITNGFSDLQELRLNRTGLKPLFEFLIVSEEVGVAKPNALIFETAYKKMNQPSRNRVLMVGDNLHSDILGGLNFGFDTCWFNPNQKTASSEIQPTYEIQEHNELVKLLTK